MLEDTNSLDAPHFIVLSGTAKTFGLELFVTEYGELLIFLVIFRKLFVRVIDIILGAPD